MSGRGPNIHEVRGAIIVDFSGFTDIWIFSAPVIIGALDKKKGRVLA